jgi:formylglycine-generating enzyme required for sulfatase activity
MGRSTTPGSADYYPNVGTETGDTPEHSAFVSDFALDKYEVTVGRFRRFVEAYPTSGVPSLPSGAGQHPKIAGTGWLPAAYGTNLPQGRDALIAALTDASFGTPTWTDVPVSQVIENRPIVNVDWYVAFAFCVWDDGRLPTEAEWEYAAAGGAENRLYPWGSNPADCTYANLLPAAPSCAASDTSLGMVTAVGSRPRGNGRWGHADLAENAWEWVIDGVWSYSSAGFAQDYAALPAGPYTTSGPGRMFREGPRAAQRFGIWPGDTQSQLGVRCARAPSPTK